MTRKEKREREGHRKKATLCDRCEKPSPRGTRVIGGLCKPCRGDDEETAEAAARGPVEKVKAAAPRESSAPRARAAVTRHPQQVVSPVLVEGDLRELHDETGRLREEIAKLNEQLDRQKWAVSGFARGFINREHLLKQFGVA